MKKGLIAVLFFFSSILLFAQGEMIRPRIDKRVELLNIIYLLANPDSALIQTNPYYFHRALDYFGKYRKHKCVLYTKKLVEKYRGQDKDIKDWELPSLAVHLTNEFQPLPSLAAASDDGWDDRALLNAEYVGLIRLFFEESGAQNFFAAQENYFQRVEESFIHASVEIDAKWVSDFFAIAPTEKYFPIQGLLSTGGAYLRSTFGWQQRNTHTLFSCDKYNSHGLPQCMEMDYYKWAMLHEYIHCFSNQLIENDTLRWKPIGEKLLSNPLVAEKVKGTFYGNWRYLLYESLVRATSIEYAAAHGETEEKIREDIERQEKLGFLWMEELVNILSAYRNDRGKHPTMETFAGFLLKSFERFAQ